MESDAERWDDRHRGAALAVPCPPEAIADHRELIDLIPVHGRALDIACGTGAQTLWLAARGLDVTALDVSPVAIDLVDRAAAAQGLVDRVDARVADLDGGLPGDLGTVDVVVCQRFRDPRLAASVLEALEPGGIGVVTVLSAVGLGGEPGPFHAPPGDLVTTYGGSVDVLLEREADGLASMVFRKPNR